MSAHIYTCACVCFSAQPSKPALLYLMTPSHEELKDNKTATFACFASEFFPEEHTFTWRLKDTEINQGITTLPPVMKKNKNKVYSATSFLRLPENQWKEFETFVSCEFKHKAGAISRTAHRTPPGMFASLLVCLVIYLSFPSICNLHLTKCEPQCTSLL